MIDMSPKYSQNCTIESTEIILGIIGPVGCNSELIVSTIENLSQHFNYQPIVIKVSDIIKTYEDVNNDNGDQYKRIMSLMDAGNKLRKDFKDNSILAKMSAIEISKKRVDNSNQKFIYIIDSLKLPEEVDTLRDIYGNGFYLFAVHSEDKQRDRFLENFCHILDQDQRKSIIKRDEDENLKHGQSTSAAFHLADFFLTENGDHDKVWNSLARYFDLIFGNPFRTPTFQEYSMFMAYSASIRSSDLSRQVGAVITQDKDIISSGSNECPKAFGGTYWPLFDEKTKEIYDEPKGRDYKIGRDHNAFEKGQIIKKIKKDIPKDVLEQLSENINKSGLNDITEYGRTVHAEMDALLGCARRGVSVQNAVMFCTTYPCHNCAKHIVASGINKVIYIEPYPKSKALSMHSDSITNINTLPRECVLFRPFMGVGPRQYINLFSMSLGVGGNLKRKISGESGKVEWRRKDALPRFKLFGRSYLEIERLLFIEIEEKSKK